MQKYLTAKFTKTLMWTATLSVITNIIFLLIVRPLAHAPETFSPFQYGPIISLTILGVIGAAIVYITLKKFFPTRYDKLFIQVSIVALILSCIPDVLLLSSTDADNQGATIFIVLMLIFMHILTAGIIMKMFTKKD